MSDFPQDLKLYVGADHAGFELKEQIVRELKSKITIEDLGTQSTESCDYPVYAEKVANAVVRDRGTFGLLICGTGIGMSIAANKVNGIRAASASEKKSAEMARKHNDAQILCLGARIIDFKTALQCLTIFLQTSFDHSHSRHERRINEIFEIEKRNP